MNRGYTLLELMIALFIFAMLVGTATPIYLHQLNKSRVAAAIDVLNDIERIAKIAYEENPDNTSIVYNGINIPTNTVTAINVDPVVNAYYIPPNGNVDMGSNEFLVCVFVGGLNFSDYVAPTEGTMGTHTRVCKQVTGGDSIYTNICGALKGSSVDIPLNYLPPTCNCASVSVGPC